MDILLLAGIAYLIYWYIKKKRREAERHRGILPEQRQRGTAAPASVPAGV